MFRGGEEMTQTQLDAMPRPMKPVAGAIIKGKGKHFAEIRDQLIEVAEKNPDFKLTIKEE